MSYFVLGLIVVLFLAGMFYWLNRTARNDHDRRRGAISALARIIRVGHSRNSEKNGEVLVHLTLEITPPKGAPYAVDTEWWVKPASLPLVEAGRAVAVKIDARDPTVIYSGEGWFREGEER